MKKALFFGTDNFSAISLRALIARSAELGIEIAGVVTRPDARRGRGRGLEPPITKVIAKEAGIPVYQPTTSNELYVAVASVTSKLDQPPIGVLVSYGRIIPQRVIDLFKPGIVNVHPSLLPLYRGPSPVETALFNGDATTGVSIMQLSAAMDAGPVYAQETVSLDGSETGPGLLQSLGEIGTELLCKSLSEIIDGTLKPSDQDASAATYCHLLSKDQAIVDPVTRTATQIDQHVRAFLDFPKTKLIVAGLQVVLRSTTPTDQADPDTLTVMCAQGSYLKINELIAPSGKRMSGEAFKNGYLR